jgi:Na+-translocating ferredoxin:NAD+ oxidoreductase subunit B
LSINCERGSIASIAPTVEYRMPKAAFEPDSVAAIDRVDTLLPQTQCGRCGHHGCRPYAEAIVTRGEPINRCPPGGTATIVALADFLRVDAVPLDPAFGLTKPLVRASIDEAVCIGCTLCIKACPVDAIVGAAKLMHTVLVDHCTGCELCLPPCPVDCIALVPAGREWTRRDAGVARERYRRHNERLAGGKRRMPGSALPHLPPGSPSQLPSASFATSAPVSSREQRQAAIAAALGRARLRRATRT